MRTDTASRFANGTWMEAHTADPIASSPFSHPLLIREWRPLAGEVAPVSAGDMITGGLGAPVWDGGAETSPGILSVAGPARSSKR